MPSVRDVRVRSDLPALSRVVTHEAVKAYADAGGDQNPLHQDEAFARAAGFPGIIAHGMFTMGHLAAFVTRWAGGPERIRRLTAQFRAPVFMGEEIVAGGRVKAVDVDRGVARARVLGLGRAGRPDGMADQARRSRGAAGPLRLLDPQAPICPCESRRCARPDIAWIASLIRSTTIWTSLP